MKNLITGIKKNIGGLFNLGAWLLRLFNANIQLFIIGCLIIVAAAIYGYYQTSN